MAIDNKIFPFFPNKMTGVIWSLENTDPCIVVWNPREPIWILRLVQLPATLDSISLSDGSPVRKHRSLEATAGPDWIGGQIG